MKHVADGHANQDFIRDYTYDSSDNKLKGFTVNSTTYGNTYDPNGSLTKEGQSRYYEWGANDKLAVFKNQAGTSTPSVYTNYFYNAKGDRIKKHTRKGNKIVVTFYMDGGMFETTYTKTVGGSIDNDRFFNTIKISDDGALIATIRVGNNVDDNTFAIKYMIGDHLNNCNAVLKTTGSLINREEYYPFGETSFGGFQYKRYRYNGKEKDEESGLYEYGQRYYAPWLCRFVSVDPAKEQRAWLTPYNYVQNNPINLTDPTGALDDGGGGGDPVKKGDTFVGDDGKTYTASIDAVEITAVAPRDKHESAILNDKLSFTANYGWVDNSHAFTDTERNEPNIGVGELWRQLKNEPSSDQIHRGYYSVNYKQDIVVGDFSIGIERQYLVKEGLNLDERKSVALAIFQDVSMAFESFQAVGALVGRGDSSFSPEDLPSNMLSFYRTIEGMERSEVEAMTKPVSPEQAIDVYRSYPGTFTDSQYKNRSFNPRYFDTPYTSSNFGVPDRLNTIKPASISSTRDFGKANLILLDQDLIRKR
ncbi:RHS repeat-associated core domain-containing protein [Cryomorpha ignava]|uniref:RHS repeat-associated core domain-containing protein n=1 Tax=Cryomorpha ignava TaxID=101383 RepID=A0A7K3WRL0_9FLAO|nr:RHS repeat-associated core domain-containing protein [Cryomorpha ignava]